MKNIQKTNKICYCFGGEIYPPKGPEKNTVELVMHTLEIRNSLPFVTNWKSGTVCLRRILPIFQLMMTQVFIYSVSVKRFQYQLVAENLSLIPRLTPLIVSFQLDTHTPLPPAQRFVQPSPHPLPRSPSPSPTLPLLPSPSTFPMATHPTRVHGHPEQQQQSLNLLHPL